MPLNLKPGKHFSIVREFIQAVWWKNETAIRYNSMYLKSPKGSKRFSSSLARDVVIAFTMTTELFFFRKEVPNRWIIIRNRATKLGLLFNYHDKL